MPKANSDHITSRRKFLGQIAAGAAVGTVAAALPVTAQAVPIALTDADADLIALCAERVGYGTEFSTVNEQGLTTDELVEDLCDDQHDVGTDSLDLEVKTLAGAIPVAKVLADYEPDWIHEPYGRNYEFVSMLVRGLIAMGMGAS